MANLHDVVGCVDLDIKEKLVLKNRDAFVYFASFFMLLLLVGILAYLTYIPVPAENKELILTILGVLLGGAASAMPNLFGSKDAETEKLRERVRQSENEISVLKAQYETLKEQHDQVMKMLVDRHILGDHGG